MTIPEGQHSVAVSHLYPRGFAIVRDGEEANVPGGWTSLPLQDSGWVFHHDAALSPSIETGVDGQWVLAYGLLLYAGADGRQLDPAARLLEALTQSEEAFLDELDHFGGRHLVIRGRRGDASPVLYQDATGMRTVAFSATAHVAASHVALVNRLRPHPARSLGDGRASFITAWGRTPRVGVEALLPNHSLQLGTWSVARFYPRAENKYTQMSVQERVDLFRAQWDSMMADLLRSDSRLIMSITGGWDSRTGLALSIDHLDQMELFTYSSRAPGKDRRRQSIARDEAIVESILDLLPTARHAYFYTEDRDTALSAEQMDRVVRNSILNHGRWQLAHYMATFPGENVVHLRGNASAIGKSPWIKKNDDDTADALEKEYLERSRRDREHLSLERRREDFRSGYEFWGYDQDLHGVHRKDLFYWEVRLGRWSAEICNESDIAFETCAAMNVRSMLEMSLSFPLHERRSSFFFAELINAAAPVLNFLGVNDTRNLYEITRDAARRQTRNSLASGSISLEDGLEIRGPHGAHRLPSDASRLQIPQDHFLPGSAAHRVFAPAEQDGELRFTLTSTYGYPTAAGRWRYQVWVDGRMHTSWDGGVSKTPVHVTVTDLRAGSVISVAAAALVDRRDSASWSMASRAQIEDIVFDARGPIGRTCVALDAPRATHPDHESSPPRLAPADLIALSADYFPVDEPTRLDVDLGECVVPLLVVRREPTEEARVVTLFNGAVDLERSQGQPVFQRSTWWQDIASTQIYVADPGTLGPDALSLAWGQVSREATAVPGTVAAVGLLAAVLGAQSPEQRTYFGSSAGGYWAWSAAILDPGSRAVVNNAQIDWTRWMAGAVNALRTARFDGILPATIRTKHPTRSSVLELWKRKKKPARIDYWVNVASDHDRVVDLPQVEAFARKHPELTENLRILRYDDETAGHNPMGREDIIEAITSTTPGRAPAEETEMPSTREDREVFIYGGCVTRDVFEREGSPGIAAYYARSPYISAFGDRPRSLPKGMDPTTIASAFQQRMVTRDIRKSLKGALKSTSPDIPVILDLLAERLPVVKYGGGMITCSSEAVRAGLKASDHPQITVDDPGFMDIWRAAADALIELLQGRKVILNKVFWATSDNEGDELPARYEVSKHNALLRQMYEYLEGHLKCETIEYPQEVLIADRNHRWGLLPFHFIDDFYQHTQKRLLEILG